MYFFKTSLPVYFFYNSYVGFLPLSIPCSPPSSHTFIECACVSLDGYVGNVKKRRSQIRDVRDRNILSLYNKLHQLVGLLADLLSIQTLTDTAVLQLSTMGVAPFFVENVSELQLSSLRLVTKVSVRVLSVLLACLLFSSGPSE